MLRTGTNARTVWVGDLKVENKVGADGKPYQSKTILFKVASNRDYTVNKVVDGKVVKERPSDFIFCRANGSVAQAIADFASAKDATGKLVSRYLSLHGAIETYTTMKDMTVNANINGTIYPIAFQVEQEQTVFIVKELDFLDSSTKSGVTPTNVVTGVVATTATTNTVATATPQVTTTVAPQVTAQVTPTVAPVVNQTVPTGVSPITAPTMPTATTVQPAQVTAQVQPSTVTATVAEEVTIPSIPEGEAVVADGTCPF